MSSRTSPSTSSLVLMPETESKSDSSRDRQCSQSTHKSQQSSSSNSDPCNYKNMNINEIMNTVCDRSHPEKPKLENFISGKGEGSNEKYERTAEKSTSSFVNEFASPYSTHNNKSKINIKNENNHKEENNYNNNNTTNMSCSTSLALNTTVPSSSITLLEETNNNNITTTTNNSTKSSTSSSSAEVTLESSEVDSSAITTSPESFLSSIVAFHSETTTPELNRYVEELTTCSHSPNSSQQEWSLQQHLDELKRHEQEQYEKEQHVKYNNRELKREVHKETPTHKQLGKTHTHWQEEKKEQPLSHNALKHDKLKHIASPVVERRRDHDVEEIESLSRIHWASPSEVLELRNTCHALVRKHEHEVNSLRSALRQQEVEKEELNLQLEKVAELKRMYEKSITETNKEKQRYLKWRAEREVMNVHLQKLRIENERQKWELTHKHHTYLPYNTNKTDYRNRINGNSRNNDNYKNEELEVNQENRMRKADNSTQRLTSAPRPHEPFTECEEMKDISKDVDDVQFLENEQQRIRNDGDNIHNHTTNKIEEQVNEANLHHVQVATHSREKALVNELSSHLLQRRSQSCPTNAISRTSNVITEENTQPLQGKGEASTHLQTMEQNQKEQMEEEDLMLHNNEHTALPESELSHLHLHETNFPFHLSSQSSSIPTPSSLHSTSTASSLHHKVINNKNKVNSGDGIHSTTSPTNEKNNLIEEHEENSHTNTDPSVTTPITSATRTTLTTIRDATLPPSSQLQYQEEEEKEEKGKISHLLQNKDKKVSNVYNSSESVPTPSSLHSSSHTGNAKNAHLRSSPFTTSSSFSSSTPEHQTDSVNNNGSGSNTHNKLSTHSSSAIRAVRRTCSPASHHDKSIAHVNEQNNINVENKQKDDNHEITLQSKESSLSEAKYTTNNSTQADKLQSKVPLATQPPRLPSSSPSHESILESSCSPEPLSSASRIPFTSPSPTNTNHDTNTSISTSLSVLYHMPRTPAEALKESIALIQERNRLATQIKELEMELQTSNESHKISEQKWEYTLQDNNDKISALRKQLQRVQDKLVESNNEKEHLSNKLHHVEEALKSSQITLQKLEDDERAKQESIKESFTAAMTQKQNEFDATLRSVEVENAKLLELAERERHAAVEAMQEAKAKLNTTVEEFAITENALQHEIHSLQGKQAELRRDHENKLQSKINENVELKSRADELERELLITRSKLKLFTDDMSMLQREHHEMKVSLDEHVNTVELLTTHNSELKRRVVEMELLHEVIARLEITLESTNDELAIQKEMYMEQLADVTDTLTHNKKCYTKEIDKLSKKCKQFANLFRLINEASDNLNSYTCHDKSTKNNINTKNKNFTEQRQKDSNVPHTQVDKQLTINTMESGVKANDKILKLQSSSALADTPCKLQCDMLELLQSSAKAAQHLSNSICNIKEAKENNATYSSEKFDSTWKR